MAVIMITGCSSGFGLGAALALARRGDKVIATVRDLSKGRPLWTDDPESRIEVIELDVTDPDSRRSAVSYGLTTYGRIDVLINNAGVFSFGPAEALGEADLRAQFETNLFGTFGMMTAVLPSMRARRVGRIVNVTSASAFAVRPFMAGYSASKHALDAITSAMDGELASFNIRVTSVATVSFATNIVRATPDLHSAYGDAPARFFEDFMTAMRGRRDPSPAVEAIVEAATAAEPRPRYLVAPQNSGFHAVIAAKEQLESARKVSR